MSCLSETGTELLARLAAQKSLEFLDLDVLDRITAGDAVEILGDSNSGKTELLYHLIARAIFPSSWKGILLNGLEMVVLFIDADQKFSVFRLMNILENRFSIAETLASVNVDKEETAVFLKSCLRRVNVITCHNTDDLIVTFNTMDEILTSQDTFINIVFIDSISAFYWSDKMAYLEQTKKLYDYYGKLVKAIQQTLTSYKMVLIATKQTLVSVKTSSSDNSDKTIPELIGDYDFMGRSWEKLITKRIRVFSKENGKYHPQTKMELIRIVDDTKTVQINGVIDNGGFKLCA